MSRATKLLSRIFNILKIFNFLEKFQNFLTTFFSFPKFPPHNQNFQKTRKIC